MKLFFIILILATQFSAYGATFSLKNKHGLTWVVLNDEIVKGDAEKFRRFVVDSGPDFRLILNSRGGDVYESMLIGEMVYALRGMVVVESGGVCASSCFFIWLNGATRHAGSFLGSAAGSLGLHRPYLKNIESSEGSLKMQVDIMIRVGGYLKSKLLPQKYIDLMMSKSSAEIHWLNFRELEEIGSTPPQLVELDLAKCGTSMDIINEKEFSAKLEGNLRMLQILEREKKDYFKCSAKLSNASADAAYMKMKSGWIPEIN